MKTPRIIFTQSWICLNQKAFLIEVFLRIPQRKLEKYLKSSSEKRNWKENLNSILKEIPIKITFTLSFWW